MWRRILAVAAVLSALPAVSANAWTLNTWAKSRGGSITVRGGAPQTSSKGSLFSNYTTSAANGNGAVPVVVTASTGYTISRVVVDGAVVVDYGGTSTSYSTSFADAASHSLYATFKAGDLNVTASAGPGGRVTPTGVANVLYGQTVLRDIKFTITPDAGFVVDPLALTGGLGARYLSNGQVIVTIPRGTVLNSDVAINATFTGMAAKAGAPQTVALGSRVTLDGSASLGAISSWSWSETAGPGFPGSKVFADNTPGQQVSFTASALGTYSFTLTVNGVRSASTTVTVTTNALGSVRSQCQTCHQTVGVGSKDNVFGNWSSSPHKANYVLCARCHVGADTGGHPGPGLTSATLLNVCSGCHVGAGGTVANHPFPIGATLCVSCHDPHSTAGTMASVPAVHFNNVTGAGYPASYVTSRSNCVDCHFDSTENATVRAQWAASGHAATTDAPFTTYDFKTRSGCVQCHTSTGFIAYSTGKLTAAWGQASDKTKELITCVACHSDITTGATRKVAPVKPFADDSYQNRNVGESNLCMDCHSGRNNGASIELQVGQADFTNLAFIAPHYLTAGGTLHGKSGYHFPGQSYQFYSSNSHRAVGLNNANGTGNGGPCVGCHMSSDAKHSYQALTLDKNGAITAIASSACASCHGGSLGTGALGADQAAYANALGVLNAMLADKGFVYSANYPYFTNTNWGSGQDGANVMGAAFNYKLLMAEPGGYAHNSAYAKKLISDSIDLLYNGTVTGSIDSALAYLLSKNEISQQAADSMTAYQGANSCTSCHTNNTGSHTAHLNYGIGCVACHSATAASNSSLIPGNTKHLNGVTDVVFQAGGSYVGGSCSNVYCHSDGMGVYQSPVWGSGALTCKSCHPVLSGAHNAHVGDLLNTVSFYNFTGNYSSGSMYRFGCANCHPTDVKSHGNGKVEVTLVPDPTAGTLRAKNSPAAVIGGIGNTGSGLTGNSGSSVVCSASYCHSNGASGQALVYASSPDWYNAAGYTGDRCAMCHGNSPATGAHGAHVTGIHYSQIFDGSGNLIPSAAPAGQVAGHGDPAQSTTINCDLCHSATVTNNANDNNTACISCHLNPAKGTPALNKALHLNGSVEVVFKGINVVSKAQVRPTSFGKYSTLWTRTSYKTGAGSFDTSKLMLSQGGWDGSGKNCSNIACHNGGVPNWNGKLSCVDCHSAL